MNEAIKIEIEQEIDILDELMAAQDLARKINMDLPFKKPKYKLLECPNCKKICAYQMPSLSSNCVYVCDWCEGEF